LAFVFRQLNSVAMASFLSWTLGLGAAASPLETDLQAITDSDALIPDVSSLRGIAVASHDEGDRRVIMSHLRECLSEPSGKRWRRILGALMIVEHLIEKGSSDLIAETGEGRHFDLGQRLWFLQSFEYTVDTRVQNIVRQKADTLRPLLLKKMEAPDVKGGCAERKCAVLTGAGVNVAAAGHCEDTDSESDSDFEVRSQRKNPKLVSVLRGSGSSRRSASAQCRVRFTEKLADSDSDGSVSTAATHSPDSVADVQFGTTADLLDLL